jgi:preprotein translocase subunit SecD
MTKRAVLLLLSALLVASLGLVAARRLGFVGGRSAGSGTASIELVLRADDADARRPRAEMDKALEVAREIIAHRLEALDARTASVSRQGANRILVRVAGIKDPAAVRTLVLARGRVEFRLLDLDVTLEQIESGRAPLGSEILSYSELSGVKSGRVAIHRRALVNDGMIKAARQDFDEAGAPAVSVMFTDKGARRFAQVTTENVGEPFAIVLDDVVLTAPVITEPITGGEAQIHGAFTFEKAKQLAALIDSGALPIRLSVVGEKAPARAHRN